MTDKLLSPFCTLSGEQMPSMNKSKVLSQILHIFDVDIFFQCLLEQKHFNLCNNRTVPYECDFIGTL